MDITTQETSTFKPDLTESFNETLLSAIDRRTSDLSKTLQNLEDPSSHIGASLKLIEKIRQSNPTTYQDSLKKMENTKIKIILDRFPLAFELNDSTPLDTIDIGNKSEFIYRSSSPFFQTKTDFVFSIIKKRQQIEPLESIILLLSLPNDLQDQTKRELTTSIQHVIISSQDLPDTFIDLGEEILNLLPDSDTRIEFQEKYIHLLCNHRFYFKALDYIEALSIDDPQRFFLKGYYYEQFYAYIQTLPVETSFSYIKILPADFPEKEKIFQYCIIKALEEKKHEILLDLFFSIKEEYLDLSSYKLNCLTALLEEENHIQALDLLLKTPVFAEEKLDLIFDCCQNLIESHFFIKAAQGIEFLKNKKPSSFMTLKEKWDTYFSSWMDGQKRTDTNLSLFTYLTQIPSIFYSDRLKSTYKGILINLLYSEGVIQVQQIILNSIYNFPLNEQVLTIFITTLMTLNHYSEANFILKYLPSNFPSMEQFKISYLNFLIKDQNSFTQSNLEELESFLHTYPDRYSLVLDEIDYFSDAGDFSILFEKIKDHKNELFKKDCVNLFENNIKKTLENKNQKDCINLLLKTLQLLRVENTQLHREAYLYCLERLLEVLPKSEEIYRTHLKEEITILFSSHNGQKIVSDCITLIQNSLIFDAISIQELRSSPGLTESLS